MDISLKLGMENRQSNDGGERVCDDGDGTNLFFTFARLLPGPVPLFSLKYDRQ
jgi:hypothetical protein